jgi:hypothetical protein
VHGVKLCGTLPPLPVFGGGCAQSASGSNPLFGGLSLPASTKHEHYTALISSLPDTDSPTVFSLPENIERSVQRATSSKVGGGRAQRRRLQGGGGGECSWRGLYCLRGCRRVTVVLWGVTLRRALCVSACACGGKVVVLPLRGLSVCLCVGMLV